LARMSKSPNLSRVLMMPSPSYPRISLKNA
jgi:hypothetical protein